MANCVAGFESGTNGATLSTGDTGNTTAYDEVVANGYEGFVLSG